VLSVGYNEAAVTSGRKKRQSSATVYSSSVGGRMLGGDIMLDEIGTELHNWESCLYQIVIELLQ